MCSPGYAGSSAGVDVENLARIVRDKFGAQYAHESSENNQIGRVAVEFRDDSPVEADPVREPLVFNAGGANTRLLSACQAISIGAITEHDREIEIQAAIGNPLDKCLQIGAGSGNQDCGIAAGHQR